MGDAQQTEGMNALRARVHADFALARRLARVEPQHFVSALVEAAGELDIDVTAEDVEAAVTRGRVEWLQRWLR
ncbi:MAG: hypothetical protein JWN27_1669 [Candidatus Eremiobacteraeota bacterium]|nr:hypothetical protein [Candidatus Eremiobacteraeota bacterium]